MPVATINGGSGTGVVNAVLFTSQQATQQGQSALQNINALLSQGYSSVSVNVGAPTNALIVGSVNGSTNGVLGTLTNNIQALLIDNTGTTTASNSRFIGNASVVAGQGGLTFVDNGGSTSIAVGGSNNAITFSSNSTNASFIGDGNNMLMVVTASGMTSITGTWASSDTITGTGNVVYNSAASAKAFINPGAANVTVLGASGAGTETVFGGSSSNTFTGTLSVTDGTGYFQGGAAGSNIMGSSSIGSTTLIGGGNGNISTAKGVGDVLVAASGSLNTRWILFGGWRIFLGLFNRIHAAIWRQHPRRYLLHQQLQRTRCRLCWIFYGSAHRTEFPVAWPEQQYRRDYCSELWQWRGELCLSG